MKVLMCGNFWRSGNAVTDECYIRDAFRKLGHEVWDFNLPLMSAGYKEIFGKDRPPEVDFALVFKRITVGDIQKLRQFTDGPILYWQFDMLWANKEFPDEEKIARSSWLSDHMPATVEADGYLSKEIKWCKGYRDRGARFFYLPMDTASATAFGRVSTPHALKSIAPGFPTSECDVVFTGTYYDFGYTEGFDRPTALKAIQERIAPIPLYIFSYNPESWKGFGFELVYQGVYDGHYPHLVAQSKINLDLSIHQPADFGCWSNRIARILLGAGFALVKYTGLMEAAFGPDGENLVYWDTPDDCAEKIRHYLSHEGERRGIAERGYQFARKYLTTEYRVRQLLTILEHEYGVK